MAHRGNPKRRPKKEDRQSEIIYAILSLLAIAAAILFYLAYFHH